MNPPPALPYQGGGLDSSPDKGRLGGVLTRGKKKRGLKIKN